MVPKPSKTDGGTMCYDRDITRKQNALTYVSSNNLSSNVLVLDRLGIDPFGLCVAVYCVQQKIFSIPWRLEGKQVNHSACFKNRNFSRENFSK